MCFELWSSAEDEVRLSALLAMRMLVGSQDAFIVDLVLRVRPTHFAASSMMKRHPTGRLYGARSFLQDFYVTYHSLNQSYEKFRRRAILC